MVAMELTHDNIPDIRSMRLAEVKVMGAPAAVTRAYSDGRDFNVTYDGEVWLLLLLLLLLASLLICKENTLPYKIACTFQFYSTCTELKELVIRQNHWHFCKEMTETRIFFFYKTNG